MSFTITANENNVLNKILNQKDEKPLTLECIDVGKKIYDEMDNCVVEWVPLLKDLSTSAEMWDYNEDWKNNFFKKTDGYMRKWGKTSETRKFRPAYSLEVWDDGKIRPVNSNRLSAEKLTNFQGWTCYLNDAIFINQRGDVMFVVVVL